MLESGEWPFFHIGPSRLLGDTSLRVMEKVRTLMSIEHRTTWTYTEMRADKLHAPSECVLCAAYADILRRFA
jgi:hypothetical protein